MPWLKNEKCAVFFSKNTCHLDDAHRILHDISCPTLAKIDSNPDIDTTNLTLQMIKGEPLK